MSSQIAAFRFSGNKSIKPPGQAAVVPFAVLNHRLEPAKLSKWIQKLAKGRVDGIQTSIEKER